MRRDLPLVMDLPEEWSTEIGRIITRWALVENRLNQIVYMLLNLEPPEGRIAVREPRCAERIDMIGELLKSKKIEVSVDLGDLRKSLADLQPYRDLVSHSVWVQMPETGQILIQRTKGNWQPPNEKNGKKSRKTHPEGGLIDLEQLRDIRASILTFAITPIKRLASDVFAVLEPSP